MAAPGTSSSLARVWKVSRTLALSSPPRVADPVFPPAVVPVVEAVPGGGAVDDAGASVGADVHPVIANAAAVAMPNAVRRRDGTCQLFLGLLLVTVDSPPTLIIALNLPQRRREIYPSGVARWQPTQCSSGCQTVGGPPTRSMRTQGDPPPSYAPKSQSLISSAVAFTGATASRTFLPRA